MPTAQSTKQLVEIGDIRENVVIMKNGSMRILLEVTSINFELRSEDEQTAILQNFQQFLNSVDFPLQIVIHSRKYDINDYLRYVGEATAALTNELLKLQASEYMKYIAELSQLANIMSKKFYIVVPFYVSEASGQAKKGFLSGLFKSQPSGVFKDEQFASYRNQLLQRADLVYGGLVGLGLKTRTLEKEELLKVFFSLYNPGVKSS